MPAPSDVSLPASAASPVWTVGHSTHAADVFVDLLRAHGIACVADVRRFRGSRRHPQFGEDALRATLAEAGIAYVGIEALGGRRRVPPGPLQLGWRNPSFRAYAAFMWTDEFAAGLSELLDLASGVPTAMMCSEVLWWRCHRALVADALCFLGHPVWHIAGPGRVTGHPYTSAARRVADELAYPEEGGTPLQFRLAAGGTEAACCGPTDRPG